jgi:membrane-associated phospholipid phosphatase
VERAGRARRLWAPAAAGVGALALAAATAGGRGQAFDRLVYRRINRAGGGWARGLSKGITELGSIWASVGAAAALGRAGRRREGLDALGAAIVMWGIGQAGKRVVMRPRPYRVLDGVRLLVKEPSGTTWPSSHPAVLLTFLTVAGRNLDLPPAIRAGAAGLAGAVGLSRIHVGVHYPADVAGGLLLGRGVADLWSALVSPRTLGRLHSSSVPVQLAPA